MSFRFIFIYRLGLAFLLVVTFWAVWANGQPISSTNAPAANAPELPILEFQAPTFGFDQIDVLEENKMLGQPLWKYAAFLLYIILAVFIAWLLDFCVGGWLKRLAARTKTQIDDILLNLIHGPLKVVAFVILLNIGLGLFDWPEHARLMLARGLIVVVAISVTYVALKVVALLLGVWRQKIVSTQDRIFAEQLLPLISKVAKIFIVIVAAILTADNLGIKITSLLAGLSIGGLALGLAAQDTIANLFGAVSIFLDKPFNIGDTIKVEGVNGTVESIGLRSTRLRSLDGHHVTIPNKTMGNAIITNITRRPAIRTEMNLGLTYDTPPEKVRRATEVLQEILHSNPRTSDVIVSFNKFTDSSLNIFVVHVWNGTDAREHFAQMQAWNLQIKQRFDAEGIEFAYPTSTVYLKNETSGAGPPGA